MTQKGALLVMGNGTIIGRPPLGDLAAHGLPGEVRLPARGQSAAGLQDPGQQPQRVGGSHLAACPPLMIWGINCTCVPPQHF